MDKNTTTITGIEQGRAKFAYDCAHQVLSKDSKFGKEYKSYVKKIPMLIKTNGLGATFAFVLSKAKEGNPYQLIYQQTTAWLKVDQKKLIDLPNNPNLVSEIITLDSPQYRAVTVEVLAFFNWLKRFADGLIEGED